MSASVQEVFHFLMGMQSMVPVWMTAWSRSDGMAGSAPMVLTTSLNVIIYILLVSLVCIWRF